MVSHGSQNNGESARVWLLLDDRAGNRSQCLGVAEALNRPCETREIRYTALGGLPNVLSGASFVGLSAETRRNLVAPWPRLVIAAGRRTAGAARAIKRASGGRTMIVQIMYPGRAGAGEFDLIAVPDHDRVHGAPNIVTMQGAPHSLTPEALAAARDRWAGAFDGLPVPRIAVFVGGSTRRKAFGPVMAGGFGKAINRMAGQCGGSLLISTSRRTGDEATDALLEQVTVPHSVYRWGDGTGNPGTENPYRGYLACADAVVVSGDSVSMCSEACAGTKPVYIYAPDGFATDKHRRLHRALFEAGYARPFGESYSPWLHAPLNAAVEVAAAIRDRMGVD